MGRRFNICITCSSGLTPNLQADLFEQLIGLFHDFFRNAKNVTLSTMSGEVVSSASSLSSLVSMLCEFRSTPDSVVSLEGTCKSGKRSVISMANAKDYIDVAISIPFGAVLEFGENVMERLMTDTWGGLSKFGIMLLAAGDELSISECPVKENALNFLGKYSLACWVIIAPEIADDMDLAMANTLYMLSDDSSGYLLFVSRNLKARFSA